MTTGTATVSGSSETVLTDSSGMTLYQFTPDAAGSVTCTGGCAAIWPPLLLPAGIRTPSGSAALSAGLGTLSNPAGGLQVTYNHWPLYTYSLDTAPGQAVGQGVAGKWYVATPTLKAPASASGSSTVPGY
ncbi:MAG TPA: hypothetical protein VNI34_09515 [Candidatus Nitrosotalea sp.]|nr:hypothetical protein [Candidatus Nitrosotalea sp.]